MTIKRDRPNLKSASSSDTAIASTGASGISVSRNIDVHLKKDSDRKIVLLAGPRQVGKTTLSKGLFPNTTYLNFDMSSDRKVIMTQSWPRDTDLLVLDEIHKRKGWKTWIKGIYDKEGNRPRLLLTGSARLDVSRKGGDSLAGRHFLYRLHPFSVAELKSHFPPEEALFRLLRHGGFPEPFLLNDDTETKRWRMNYLDRILHQDLIELEAVREIKSIEILVDLLAERVGSTISYASLARDLEVSPHSVKKWIQILESLYIIFTVTPYSKRLSRSILKEPKVYFYDIGRVKDDAGARFENLVACALLKHLNYRADVRGEKTQLFYLRDKEKREVDFLTLFDGKIDSLVEAKVGDSSFSKSLAYFNERLAPKFSVQVVHELKEERQLGDIKIVKAAKWLSELG